MQANTIATIVATAIAPMQAAITHTKSVAVTVGSGSFVVAVEDIRTVK